MYCDYKKFSNQIFWKEFVKDLSENNVQEDQFDLYQSTAFNILNKHAPVKKIHIKNNLSDFSMKGTRNTTMICSQLLNKFREEKEDQNKNTCNK